MKFFYLVDVSYFKFDTSLPIAVQLLATKAATICQITPVSTALCKAAAVTSRLSCNYCFSIMLSAAHVGAAHIGMQIKPELQGI